MRAVVLFAKYDRIRISIESGPERPHEHVHGVPELERIHAKKELSFDHCKNFLFVGICDIHGFESRWRLATLHRTLW